MGIIHASFYKFTLNQKIDKDVDSGDFNIMLVSDFGEQDSIIAKLLPNGWSINEEIYVSGPCGGVFAYDVNTKL
jgi:hypothetical protein